MRILQKIIVIVSIFSTLLSAFEIDPFDSEASLLENFSTNCLQMTQSQQILKDYMMIGLHSNFGNPKESLSRTIPLYDKRAHQIREYFQKHLNGHEAAKKAFDEAMMLWSDNKVLLLQKPTRKNAVTIKNNFLKMIDKLLAGTKPLATPELELISLTGKLCRKPLEITIDYLLQIWGVKVENYDKDINQIIVNYARNLKVLSANKLNNEESRVLLREAKKQFMYFEFAHRDDKISIPSLLSKKADNNFKIIREIKKVFKKQASLSKKKSTMK